MDIETVKRLVFSHNYPENSTVKETPKVDFKRVPYKLHSSYPDSSKETINEQWEELIKDIVAITNGNIGYAHETGYLIVGVANTLRSDGTPSLHNVDGFVPSRKQILDKLKNYCTPRIHYLECSKIPIGETWIWVIEIKPSKFVHRLSQQLQHFSPHTLLLRREDGEETYAGSPDEWDALKQEKAQIYSRTSEREALLDLAKELDEALETNPHNQKKLLKRAEVAEKLNDFEKVEEMYEKLLLLNPDGSEKIITRYSDTCKRMNQPEKALEILNRDTQPGPKILEKKGLLQDELDRPDEAKDSYRQAQELYQSILKPDDYVTRTKIGILLRSQGKYRESIDLLNEVLKISPNYRAAKYEKKISYYELFKGGL